MKLLIVFAAICLVQAIASPTILEERRAWPPLMEPSPPEPEEPQPEPEPEEPQPPPRSRCDAPVCSGLQIYLQPTHVPSQFFQCTVLGRHIVGTCPLGLLFSYTAQSCVLSRNWVNEC